MRYFISTPPDVIILSKAEGDIEVTKDRGRVAIQKLTGMQITTFRDGEKCIVDFIIDDDTRTFYAYEEISEEIYNQIVTEQSFQTTLISHALIANDDTVTKIL
jgi:hypothetical protein